MKWLRRALFCLCALLVLLGGGLAWARLLAGGPVIPLIPGGTLSGELARELPNDWSFANREPFLTVESRAFSLPWSGSVWFLAHGGRLHLLLPGFFGDALHRRLQVDPRVRVRIDGKLYEQVAVLVTDDRSTSELLAPVIQRQFAIEIRGPVRRVAGQEAAPMWIYRLEDPRGARREPLKQESR